MSIAATSPDADGLEWRVEATGGCSAYRVGKSFTAFHAKARFWIHAFWTFSACFRPIPKDRPKGISCSWPWCLPRRYPTLGAGVGRGRLLARYLHVRSTSGFLAISGAPGGTLPPNLLRHSGSIPPRQLRAAIVWPRRFVLRRPCTLAMKVRLSSRVHIPPDKEFRPIIHSEWSSALFE